MRRINLLYRTIVLLIIVGAFPISITSVSADMQKDNSLICKFDDINNSHINCDHCNYYFDHVDLISSHKNISEFLTVHSAVGFIITNNFSLYSSLPSNRSPPIV